MFNKLKTRSLPRQTKLSKELKDDQEGHAEGEKEATVGSGLENQIDQANAPGPRSSTGNIHKRSPFATISKKFHNFGEFFGHKKHRSRKGKAAGSDQDGAQTSDEENDDPSLDEISLKANETVEVDPHACSIEPTPQDIERREQLTKLLNDLKVHYKSVTGIEYATGIFDYESLKTVDDEIRLIKFCSRIITGLESTWAITRQLISRLEQARTDAGRKRNEDKEKVEELGDPPEIPSVIQELDDAIAGEERLEPGQTTVPTAVPIAEL